MTALSIAPEDLDSIASDIWTTYVSPDAVVLPTDAPDHPFATDRSAQVMITGGSEATVVVACDEGSATDLARRLFGAADDAGPSAEDVIDAIGEMANVLGGNVKSLSLLPSILTLPLMASPDDESPVAGRDASCCVDVIWEGGRATLSVWIPA